MSLASVLVPIFLMLTLQEASVLEPILNRGTESLQKPSVRQAYIVTVTVEISEIVLYEFKYGYVYLFLKSARKLKMFLYIYVPLQYDSAN